MTKHKPEAVEQVDREAYVAFIRMMNGDDVSEWYISQILAGEMDSLYGLLIASSVRHRIAALTPAQPATPALMDEVRQALTQCRDQFAFYAREHTEAGKVEKAATNERFARLATEALAKLPQKAMSEGGEADHVAAAVAEPYTEEEGGMQWSTKPAPTTSAYETMRAALRKIADAPAWGYPDRWETTPSEVRFLARDALDAADVLPPEGDAS